MASLSKPASSPIVERCSTGNREKRLFLSLGSWPRWKRSAHATCSHSRSVQLGGTGDVSKKVRADFGPDRCFLGTRIPVRRAAVSAKRRKAGSVHPSEVPDLASWRQRLLTRRDAARLCRGLR